MTLDVLNILLLLGITIILGYVGKLVFEKTRISDIIWLILLGIIAGPVLGLVDVEIFKLASGLLSSFALIIILFDAGLNMDIFETLRSFPRGLIFTVLGVLAAMGIVGIFSTTFLGFSWILALFLGVVLSDISTPIITSIFETLKVRESIKMTLQIESVLTDPINIVIGIALLQLLTAEGSVNLILQSIFGSFALGATIGLITGLGWLFLLNIVRKDFDYILSLGIIMIIYVLSEILGGSGSIAALMFGIVLGSEFVFSKLIKNKKQDNIGIEFKKFHKEITFFVKSFFFVYLGIVLSINPTYILYGIILAALLLIARRFTVKIGTYGMKISKFEYDLMKSIAPRGLTAAVLAQLPLSMGIEGGEIILDITFTVIIATVIYSTYWIRKNYKPESQKDKL